MMIGICYQNPKRSWRQRHRSGPRLKAAAAQKLQAINTELASTETDPIAKLKQGFSNFKQQKYLKNPEVFSKLSQGQSPTYMLVACGDSRVCPSNILGFEPGEAFVIRNVANLVPEWNATDLAGTSAAVDFAVQALKVQHLIVVGHSRCGGIKALMSLPDENAPPNGYIEKWISIAKPARARTKATVGHLPFEAQCSHCEKESVNQSLSNLLTFPFIKDLVSQEKLFLHGGYYNFVDGTFEIWSLSSKASTGNVEQEIANRAVWS
eukprot:TRINITY_DN9793_c0_g1_i4.p1 TRINITY_DN9793_c0_g1~~TRINITY_DN9793_c0_g1_i4.p1  ORF type:complete len:265 (+),score=45.06 TRINITY_DN9793_c0_g1_i4:712-1506(+)